MYFRGGYSLNHNVCNIESLFYGHEFDLGTQLKISCMHNESIRSIKALVTDTKIIEDNLIRLKRLYSKADELEDVDPSEIKKILDKTLFFREITFEDLLHSYKLSKSGDIYDKSLTQEFFLDTDISMNLIIHGDKDFIGSLFVNSEMIASSRMLDLFDQVVLTPEEQLAYKALQILDSRIERIAPVGAEIKSNGSHGGFYVKLSDSDKRIPIGSMGDGVWRMLGLSLALVAAKDGVLLVDEIDTGLHYTALEDMWKLIWETAKKLNVQVFATTHSRDCWESMEVLAHRDDVEEEDISIQRIEKDTPRSVVFNKKGIATAAKREIEVR